MISKMYKITDKLARDMSFDKPSTILPFLYTGSGTNAKNVAILKQHGISCVLNLAPITVMTGPYFYPHDWEYKEYNLTGLNNFSYFVKDL